MTAPPNTPGRSGPLQFCDGCGDRVPRLDEEGRCELCQEIDARLDAHVVSAMADLTERFVDLALCYLHPDDVREIVDRIAPESEPFGPRLREVYETSHRFVEARERLKGHSEQSATVCAVARSGVWWRSLRRPGRRAAR